MNHGYFVFYFFLETIHMRDVGRFCIYGAMQECQEMATQER